MLKPHLKLCSTSLRADTELYSKGSALTRLVKMYAAAHCQLRQACQTGQSMYSSRCTWSTSCNMSNLATGH